VLVLLDADPDTINIKDLHLVAEGISELWERSKGQVAADDAVLLVKINARLRYWLPHTPFATPLDIVIPTWETLWRVVGVSLAYAGCDVDMAHTFGALSEQPSRDVFTRTSSASGYSPEMVVLEVLRMYPPTRRIARQVAEPHPLKEFLTPCIFAMLSKIFPNTLECNKVVMKADVEAAHRDTSVWGEKANLFDPRRFASGPRHAIYAFGTGQLSCIASSWAPMASAVIVSSILQAMTDLNLEITAGQELGGRSGWEGWGIDKKNQDR
jgi:hypothetical protein